MSSSTQLLSLSPAQLNKAITEQFKTLIRQTLVDLRCATPAQIIDFDEDTQTATVQILTSELVKFPGGGQWKKIGQINHVPVMCLRAGGFSVTMPITAGDEGMLIFTDSCLDQWWQNGGQQPPEGAPLTQPNFEWTRRHDLTDCGFYPGLWNQTRVLEEYSTDAVQIRTDNGEVFIEVSEGGIRIINNSGDIDIQASGDINLQAGENINIQGTKVDIGNETTIDGVDFLPHTHSDVQSGSGDTGPVVP